MKQHFPLTFSTDKWNRELKSSKKQYNKFTRVIQWMWGTDKFYGLICTILWIAIIITCSICFIMMFGGCTVSEQTSDDVTKSITVKEDNPGEFKQKLIDLSDANNQIDQTDVSSAEELEQILTQQDNIYYILNWGIDYKSLKLNTNWDNEQMFVRCIFPGDVYQVQYLIPNDNSEPIFYAKFQNETIIDKYSVVLKIKNLFKML